MSNKPDQKPVRPGNSSRPLFAVIVDGLGVKKWQAQALVNISDDADFLILSCANSRSHRQPLRHLFYYILNAAALKSPETKRGRLPETLSVVDTISFEAETEGSWQRLPDAVLDCLDELRPDALIKFGMGLLRVPERLACPILSYHHGDPSRYRGRPAGFYETLNGDACVGQVIQILSNRLDAGKIVASAETRVHPHSYRATMREAYRASSMLLRLAIANAAKSAFLPIEPNGRNYRLPSNATVARFWARLGLEKLRRVLYGAFYEKSWRVAQATIADRNPERMIAAFPLSEDWVETPCPPGYRFLADPFPDPRGGLLVEALRRRDDRGEIIRLGPAGLEVVCSGRGHFSYPATTSIGPDEFILPEVSEWSTPRVYRLADSGVASAGQLNIPGSPRLKDATPFVATDGRVFLFGNSAVDGAGILRLWSAASLDDRFREHPRSPIRISPAGARMGGSLFFFGTSLFRIGQNCTRDYGNGVLLFEISKLSETEYSERLAGECKFIDFKGPHTINFADGKVVFDFHSVRFSLSAGWRRIRKEVASLLYARKSERLPGASD